MTPTPDFRRRRLAFAGIALAILTMSHLHDEPVIGTLSVTVDTARMPQVQAALAPPLDMAVSLLTDVAMRLIR